MNDVDVALEGAVPEALADVVAELAEQALAALELSDCELSVLLCDDAVIRPLNEQWRGKDAATDVLSFPLEGDAADGDDVVAILDADGPRMLGDLVVSVDTAARQAAELGHGLHDELRVLLVHGLLHLLGHDHEDPDDAAEMRAAEARVLAAMGGGVGLVDRAGG
ncbi:MAG: rRNA maturation RNase YbeY [Alphaproteobacteria bacterium]|nr:rRNA maturation RNase YbeY [Alphaproteobacteria bacterium]